MSKKKATNRKRGAVIRSTAGLSGVELISRERARQMSEEGWTPTHDDTHRNFELSKAGACYASAAMALSKFHRTFKAEELHPPMFDYLSWPWETKWWRPVDDPIRNLVKAGALIAAEIDRLNRAKRKPDNDPSSATRPAGRNDCKPRRHAGFAAAHG